MASSDSESKTMTAAGVDPDLAQGIPVDQGKTPKLWLPGKKRRRPRNFVEDHRTSPSGRRQGLYSSEGPLASFFNEEEYGKPADDLQDRDKVYNWLFDDAKRAQIEEYLKKKGFAVNNWNDLSGYWKLATDQASNAWEQSHLRKSPFDILDQMAPYEKQQNIPWKGTGYDQTTQQVDFANMAPETAQGILSNALQNALGRGPTDSEIADFASRANAIVHENPRIATTQHHMTWDPNKNGPNQGGYDETGQVTQESGADSQGVTDMVTQNAIDSAQQSPEYGAYQASTTYMNALMQLIMGGG